MRRFQYLRQLFFARAQTAQAHGHGKHLVDQGQGLTFAGIERTGQNPHQGQKSRTKIPALDLLRQRLINQFAAILATINRLKVFGNFRRNGRNIDSLMPQRLFISFLQMGSAAWTEFRFKFDAPLDQLGRQQGSQMRRMSFSCPAFFAYAFRRSHRSTWWVGRWRFGGVLRVHSQPPLEFLIMCFQVFVFLFQQSQSLLQHGDFLFQRLYICVLVHSKVIGHGRIFT